MATRIVDTFTEAGGSLIALELHTPELGGPWVKHPAFGAPNFISVDASVDRIFPAANNGALSCQYAGANLGGTEQRATFTEAYWAPGAFGNAYAAAALRLDVAAQTLYYMHFFHDNSFYVARAKAGVIANVGSYARGGGLPVSGTTFACELVCRDEGADVRLEGWVDGVKRIDVLDNSASKITAAGKGGVFAYSSASSTTGITLDTLNVTDNSGAGRLPLLGVGT